MRRYKILVYNPLEPKPTLSIVESRKVAVGFAEQKFREIKGHGLVQVQEDDDSVILSLKK